VQGAYRRTQISWALVISLTVVSLILAIPRLPPVLPLLSAFIILPLFGWLTVSVDERNVSIRFGVGLIRRVIPLAAIGAWQAVRNPWWSGWGIRYYPEGTLYNASGLDAVELALADGARVRIGTAEPQALIRVLTGRLGSPSPMPPMTPPAQHAGKKWATIAIPAFFVTVTVGVVIGIALQSRTPEVSVSNGTFSVKSGFYGSSVRIDEVGEVRLEERMPHILRKTNGFALGAQKRGHFLMDGLGHGQLYLESDTPPFVLIRLRNDFVFVAFVDAARTRKLFDDLVAAGAPASQASSAAASPPRSGP
jgi:hypothetical protein